MIKIIEKIENVGPICRYWLAQHLDKVNSNPLGQELKSPAGTYLLPSLSLAKTIYRVYRAFGAGSKTSRYEDLLRIGWQQRNWKSPKNKIGDSLDHVASIAGINSLPK